LQLRDIRITRRERKQSDRLLYKCLKENPRHFEAHYNLANLYAEWEIWRLLKFITRSQLRSSLLPNSHFNLGLTLAMNKEIEEAILSLQSYSRLVSHQEKKQALELINNLSHTLGN